MEPSYRFTLDLVGLSVFSLALLLSLIFLPVLDARVVLALGSLTWACLAWFFSLMEASTHVDWCAWMSATSLSGAVLFALAALIVAVFP
jgi:hypothetical protein